MQIAALFLGMTIGRGSAVVGAACGAAAARPVHGLARLETLLQDVRVRGLDLLVILLLRLHNVESEPLVEVDGGVVVDLDVQEDGVKVAVLLYNVHHVIEHCRADA